MYMQKTKSNGEIDIYISEYKNKREFNNQIFGNFGAVINGLLRSIKRLPSAL